MAVGADRHVTGAVGTGTAIAIRLAAEGAKVAIAYLPEERITMEGDLGDEAWTWHWWAGALSANIAVYGLDPVRNVAVHGPPGGLPIDVGQGSFALAITLTAIGAILASILPARSASRVDPVTVIGQ